MAGPSNPSGPGQVFNPGPGDGSGGRSTTAPRTGEVFDQIVIRPLGANTQQPGENYRVPPGYGIEVWPQPTNGGNVFVAEGPTQVAAGPREVYLPTSFGRSYPGIKNISQLWFRFANAADEAVVRIVR